MADNTLLSYFFKDSDGLNREEQFHLTRDSRSKRLREMIHILHKHKVMKGFSPEQFRLILEDLGPSFVKIGQALSTRSEILPRSYCEELSKLQTQCVPMPFEQVKEALRSIYGQELISETFASLDPKPLGSASLAQVHKAILKNGDVVAVKIQRPGVRETMAQDIDLMRSLVKRANRFIKPEKQMVDFRGIVEELWNTFLEETDFTVEAKNLQRFAENNKDVVYIRCPKPYMELCREEVLVMEYVNGIPINHIDELLENGYNLEEIGEKILDNYATQILDHGFFHADPHPGNIVIKGGQIVYLDLGLMGYLSPRDRGNFRQIIEAVGQKSSSGLKDALIAFSVSHDLKAIDHPRFLAELDVVVEGYGSCDVADIDIGAMLTDIMSLAQQCKVTLPSSVTDVSRGIVIIEGTLSEYIGNFNIIDIINSHIMRDKTSQEQLNASLQELVFALNSASRGLVEASAHSGEALRMLTRGQLKMNMNMLGSDEPFQKLSRIMNRLVMGVIVVGLLVSGGMVASIEGIPQIFGISGLSVIEFASAFILSAIIVADIYRAPR
ncbi:MAG: ABC1 kinase family protein [Anaerotardibacter sp.]